PHCAPPWASLSPTKRAGKRNTCRPVLMPQSGGALLARPAFDLVLVGADPGGRNLVQALAIQIDLGDERVHLRGVELVVLGDAIGGRPFVLHAGPRIFPDFTMWLAAIIRQVLVYAPGRVGVAFGRVFRELDPLALVFGDRPMRRIDPEQDRGLALIGGFQFGEHVGVGAGMHDFVVEAERLYAFVIEAAPGDG